MRKWLLFSITGFSLLGLNGLALASDANAILPTNDTLGCTGFIQQGDVNPPVPTSDLNNLQICMNNCDQLYKSLGDRGRTADMLRGVNYCRQSLNNLYFSSIAQTITNELNQQTQQKEATEQQSIYDKLAAIIKQQQQNQQNSASVHQPDETDNSMATTTPSPQYKQSAPIGPPDNVNW